MTVTDSAKLPAQKFGMFQSAPEQDDAARQARAARCPVTEMSKAFQPFSPEYINDPYQFFAYARDREPVFFGLLGGDEVPRYRQRFSGSAYIFCRRGAPPGNADLSGSRKGPR
ncbi:MAG: hypothetical protein NWT00_03195 [Beijerinckiaceae bacterium]|nr:hypothetical protein [Beijerinckiaceae bacterium]